MSEGFCVLGQVSNICPNSAPCYNVTLCKMSEGLRVLGQVSNMQNDVAALETALEAAGAEYEKVKRINLEEVRRLSEDRASDFQSMLVCAHPFSQFPRVPTLSAQAWGVCMYECVTQVTMFCATPSRRSCKNSKTANILSVRTSQAQLLMLSAQFETR